jgi:peptidyl-Lys metalloendopeptidase
MKMFSRWLMASALLALSATAQLQAQTRSSGLSVTLSSPPAILSATQDVTVDVTLTNFSAEPVQVLRWYTPLAPASTGLFNITRNGEPVDYVGALVKRGVPTSGDYLTIAAGASVTRAVELSALYDLSATGVYSIQYDVESMHTYRGALPRTALSADVSQRARGELQDLSSNTVAVTIMGSAARPSLEQSTSQAGRIDVTPAFAPAVSTVGCSNTQATQVTTALSSAETYAANGVSYLNAGTRGPRYTTWFGIYDAKRYATVRSHFLNISNAASTQPVQFDCSTCPAGPDADAYAYVFSNQPYKVFLCNAFWAAPNTGTDSRAGTIIHELSHFTVVAGTSDYAYGQTAARNLAVKKPARAIQNADSHEYFSENTPQQN